MRTSADSDPPTGSGRREFLRAATALTGLAVLPRPVRSAEGRTAAPAQTPASADAPPFVYLALDPAEAAFVEHLVEVMCPADELTPGGVACGLAVFIDPNWPADSAGASGSTSRARGGPAGRKTGINCR